jgi:iron complex transport system permease protein
MKHLTLTRWITVNGSLLCLLAVVLLFSASMGAEQVHFSDFLSLATDRDRDILLFSRLPRLLLGAITGWALSSAGAAYQSLLRNPLADPYTLGVSGGAALGSIIGVGLGLPFTLISLIAFLSALASMSLIYWIARIKGRLPTHTLLLTGAIFNAFCFAIILFINSIVTIEQVHQIMFFLVGSLSTESYQKLTIISLFVASGFMILMITAGKMNVISLGDESAQQLGVDVEKYRRVIFFAASLMIGSVVSVCGLIGFVGLFIPHMVRLLWGPDHRLLLPASALLGAAFLTLSDTLARTILATSAYQTELPVGVITALLGGPFFVYLLKKQQRNIL